MTTDLKGLALAVKAAREAGKAKLPTGDILDELLAIKKAIGSFLEAATPDAILALIRERDEALERERQTFKDAAEINTRAEAALAAMEREGVKNSAEPPDPTPLTPSTPDQR